MDGTELVYRQVELGILDIDEYGQIWKVQDGRGWSDGKFRACVPRRVEREDSYGYLVVGIRSKIVRMDAKAHRLVWRHFNGPLPKGLQINHMNGIKCDNRPENLELVTNQQNMNHATATGLINNVGKRYAEKLDMEQAQEIICLLELGYLQREIAEMYGIAQSSVSRIKRGVTYAR